MKTTNIDQVIDQILFDLIPDDEYSVSIKEAKNILVNIVGAGYTLLDIVDQVRLINNEFYYRLYKKSSLKNNKTIVL